MQTLLTKVAVLTPVTTAVVQAIKLTGFPPRFLPLIAVALGAGFGWLVIGSSAVGVVAGVALGLSSVGLFEIGRTTVMNG